MMALPRHREFGDAPRPTPTGHIPVAPQISARTADHSEAQARYRAGHRSAVPGHPDPIWVERRNGLPDHKPYVWRGGRDPGANCRTCELWLGCGGAFCEEPIQRAERDGAP